MKKIYKTEDLMLRYNMKAAALRKLIRSKLSVINETGIHAKLEHNEWRFDEQAVVIIDKLRGVGVAVVEVSEDSERIHQLLKENSALKTMLMTKMDELNNAYKKLGEQKLIAVSAENVKNELDRVQNALSKADQRAAEATIRERQLEIDLALAKEKITHEQDKLSSTEASLAVEKQAKENAERNLALANNQIAEKDNELEKLKQQITEERNKSFWKRLFG